MNFNIYNMDVKEGLQQLDNESIDMVITSPPYWGLRDYGVEGQISLEKHPQEYINKMVNIFGLMKKKLKKTGSFYLNVGDTYYGGHIGGSIYNKKTGYGEKANIPQLKEGSPQGQIKKDGGWIQEKQLMLMPSRLAIALQDDGWVLRNDIIWHKPSHMPSSVKDRLTNSYEHLFHFVQTRKYFYDLDAIREPHKTDAVNKIRDKSIEDYNVSYPGGHFSRGERPEGHPSGKNPADVWKDLKKNVYGDDDKTSRRSRTVMNLFGGVNTHKFGKNPGDVLQLGNSDKYEFQENINGTLRQKRELDASVGTQWRVPTKMRFQNPQGKNPSDFWSINPQPFPEAHFAVFPEALCIKPIKASCPTQICKKCGKPRERITKTDYEFEKDKKGNLKKNTRNKKMWQEAGKSKFAAYGDSDCSCGEGFEAGIVLDPFMGSGTVLVIAQKLRRNAIGIEIKPEYCEMAKKRLEKCNGQTYLNGDIDKIETIKDDDKR